MHFSRHNLFGKEGEEVVFVCGVLKDGILYVIDNKFYSTSSGAKKRCKYLNEKSTYGKNDWIVLFQDVWKPYKD